MARARQVFACRACGAIQSKWMGKCPDCGTWDALEAQTVEPKAKVDPRASSLSAWRAGAASLADADDEAGPDSASVLPEPVTARSPAKPIAEIDSAVTLTRLKTGQTELDRVLGGGLVPGSAILLGGDPGIGKSTLLLQAARALAAGGHPTLYVSSEESAEQVKMRFARLSAGRPGAEAFPERLFLLAETSLARITEQAARVLGGAGQAPPVLIIDSVQMIYKADLDAFPGSLTQLRRCCAELVYLAKASGTTVILVGHVTKDGQLAGPRMLEHLVDAVLYFEGDRYHAHRLVRAVKNRFGTTLELGLMEMTAEGLIAAEHSASTLAAQRLAGPGTVVCPVMTGSRCLLVEIQALTATGFLGAAKRKSSGLDASRLAMLIAVLEQHGGLRLADRDIFASAVGGVRVAEPAADLALALAIAGAHAKRALGKGVAAVGEVGLAGEVRPVAQLEARLLEAGRLGFSTLLVPASRGLPKPPAGLTLVPVPTLAKAMDQLA
jgi:DNA repair protein RadA/Sms